jgi:hypothetical protein
MNFKPANQLQRFALLAILLSIFLLCLGLYNAYVVHRDNLLILNVRVIGLHTYHELNKNGINLVYGNTGQIFYHAKTYFDTLKYDHFEQNIANYLVMIILAVTVFVRSLKKGQVLFSKETIMKFYSIIGLYIFLTACKWMLIRWINDDFYNTTGRIFKLDLGEGRLANSWQLIMMLFMFTVTGIISAGIEQRNKDKPAEPIV